MTPMRPILPIPPIPLAVPKPRHPAQTTPFGSKTRLSRKLFSFLYVCKICTHPT
jgi:hypothetical protein